MSSICDHLGSHVLRHIQFTQLVAHLVTHWGTRWTARKLQRPSVQIFTHVILCNRVVISKCVQYHNVTCVSCGLLFLGHLSVIWVDTSSWVGAPGCGSSGWEFKYPICIPGEGPPMITCHACVTDGAMCGLWQAAQFWSPTQRKIQ